MTFDPNGGTLDEADKTKSLTTGETYGTLPVPNYAGYDFAGWYTEKGGGTEIKENTTVTVFGTQTLYAHWTPIHVHAYTQQVQKPEALKTPADCTNNAVYYLSCACGEVSTNDADTFTAANTALDHDWGEWTQNSDEKTHARICKRDASHTETGNCHGGTADCTHRAVCTICGGEYGEIAAHSFTAEKAEAQYLKSAATCTEKAIYYKSCTVCGLSSEGTADEAIFFSGNVLDHDWDEPSYTWKPVPDGFMCTATKVCQTCHTDVSEIATVTYAVTTKPTCLHEGTGTYTATFSAAYGFPVQTKDVTLPATDHDWGKTEYTWTSTEDGYSCTAKHVCRNDGTHAETETAAATYFVATEPTCLTTGLGRYQASFEADWAEDAFKDVPLAALEHMYGDWVSNGDGTHTRKCTVDGCKSFEIKDCSGGKATCTYKAKCEVCGAEYGELDPNNHADLKHVPAKAATKTAEGNIEYWYCEGCGKYFSDKDGTKEIKKADTTTAKLKDDSKSSQTGDTRNLALWIALLFVSGGAAIGITVISRKKKYNR